MARVRYRDPLTRLWNRRVFQEALDEALSREPKRAGTIAVYLICLRNFRSVNDEEGVEAGDAALQVVARRLADAVGSDGFVARIGGDQFMAMLDLIADSRDAAAAAALLLEAVEAPLTSSELPPARRRLAGRTLMATVGAAISAPGLTSDDLWRRADEATHPAEHGTGRGVGGPRAVLYVADDGTVVVISDADGRLHEVRGHELLPTDKVFSVGDRVINSGEGQGQGDTGTVRDLGQRGRRVIVEADVDGVLRGIDAENLRRVIGEPTMQ